MAPAVALGTVVLLALTFLAFWPTYLSKPFNAIDRYTHAHAATGALWLLLILAQVQLIRLRNRSAHRTLGRLSYILAPAFVLSSVLLAHHRFSAMDAATFAREAYTLYLPLTASVLFAAAFSLAILHRRTTFLHARFMACTALLLVDPVVGRVLAFHVIELPAFWHYQLITFGAELGVLAYLCGTLGPARENRPFLVFASAYAAVLLLWFVAPQTAPWLAFATWFRSLHIT